MSRYHFLTKAKVKKNIHISLMLVFVASAITSVFMMPSSNTDALSGSQFNPGRIIDDAVFYNKNTMSAAQIQNFLNSKVPNCDSNCLKDYRQNTKNIAPESGLCGGYSGKSNETAAQIIYKVAQSCGINPQVILVMLQKEQGLITSTRPSNTAYEKAMGAFCPDTAPCDPTYKGFFYQVYYGAHRFKVYRANPSSFNYRAGRNNFILYNPDTKCGGSNVYIQNQATAGLYIYTPYQPNPATLAVGLGVEAPCGAYGNKNFWWLFNVWFGPTTGTPFFRINNNDAVYIIGHNNSYYHVPSRDMLHAYGYGRKIKTIASVSSDFISGQTYRGKLPPIARYEGDEVYLIDRGEAHHFTSRQLLEHYGYTLGDEAKLPSYGQYSLTTGSKVYPLARSTDGPEVYYVQNGEKRHIADRDAYNSGNPPFSSRSEVNLSARFLSGLNNGAPILASNRLILRSDSKTYTYWDGSGLQEIDTNAAKNLLPKPDYSAASSEINQLPKSSRPKAGKLVKDYSGQLYVLDNRKKISITHQDLSSLNTNTSSFIQVPDQLLARIPTEKFKNVVRINDGDAVYSIEAGELKHFDSRQALSEAGSSLSDVISINVSTSALFQNNGKKIFATGTLYRLGTTDAVYLVNTPSTKLHVRSRRLMSDYGFSFDKVRSISASQVVHYADDGSLDFITRDTQNRLWLVQQGTLRRPLTSAMQSSEFLDINPQQVHVMSESVLSKYRIYPTLKVPIRARGTDPVYLIESGKKRRFANRRALAKYQLSMSMVMEVSVGFVDSIPTGSDIDP